MFIYNQIKQDWGLSDPKFRFMLGWSALLHEIGLQVNSRGIQKHSSYILSHSDLPGFNQEQQKVMSALVRFHRKKIAPDDFPNVIEFSETCIARMLIILRLGILLNVNRQVSNDILKKCEVKEESIKLTFNDGLLNSNALLLADLNKETHYLKQLKVKLKSQ
jgi:exopolyphosphatase/guanosine-5'-triphosphate,3'-diphosphate pyrophosphatase